MRSILYIFTFLFALAASPILGAPTPEASVEQQEVQEQQAPQTGQQEYHLTPEQQAILAQRPPWIVFPPPTVPPFPPFPPTPPTPPFPPFPPSGGIGGFPPFPPFPPTPPTPPLPPFPPFPRGGRF